MRTRILSAWLVGALPLAVSAQTATPTSPEVKGVAAVGGLSTVDFVTLRAGNLGAPLRFGHVVPNSEQVQLEGRVLTNGPDYGMDYETGVVYLKRAQRTGDQMVVSYRYDPQGKTTSAAPSFTGVNSFAGLSLMPGLGLVGGLGLAERAADGSVMSTNVFGWNSALSVAGGRGSLGGLILFADRQKNDNRAGLSMDMNARPGDASTEQGTSQFLLQNFRSSLFGGSVTADVQDISKNFTAAGQVKAAGYADGDVARLMKERGLKRQAMGLQGVKFGNALISTNFKQVEDGKGKGLDWSSYGYQQGGLKLNYSGQRVNKGFSRFADLSEADRDQLAREIGMGRQNLAGEFAQKAGKLTFSSTDIKQDQDDRHLVSRVARLDTGKIGLDFGQQEVDKSFGRIGSLTGAEQAQYGRAVGTQRQWVGLTAALGGKTTPQNFAFSNLDLKGQDGRLVVQDMGYQGKRWTLDHVRVDSSGKASPASALLDGEGNNYTKRLGGFFNTPNINDGQRGAFLASTDVKRDFTRLAGDLGKGAKINADSLSFGEGKKGGVAQSVAIDSPKVKAAFRKQDFGDKFTDATRLADFERNRLGAVAGLQRTDVSFGVQIDKAKSFAFGQTMARDNTGNLGRTTMAYNDKGLVVNAAQRDVSKGFASAAGLVDPENSLLQQFVGFKERDLGIAYSGTPGLRVQTFMQDAQNDVTKESRAVVNTDVQWQVDKATSLSYQSQRQNAQDSLATLFSQSLQRVAVAHSFGPLLKMSLMDEQIENSGKNNAAPDSRKQVLTLESQVDKQTSLRTQQTRTAFGDGNKEDISANSVSRALAKNVGVTVTDVAIDRKGEKNDEKKVNYGFWYDFGKGVRFTYGYAQSLVGEAGSYAGGGTQMFTFGATPNAMPGTLAPNQVGQIGAANVGALSVGGGYGLNQTLSADPNANRTQSFSNLGIQTAKPFAIGDLKDMKVNLSVDQAADYSQYVRRNQSFGLSGRLGKNLFSFGYRDQLVNPNPNPTAATQDAETFAAIDRTVALTTDPNPKAPLVVNGAVKFRSLPDDKDYASRNVTVTARPAPGIEITNQVQTNLEQANPNVLLGSTLLADRANKWTFGYRGNGDTSFAASWEQKINDQTDASSVLSAVTLTLFQHTGGPLKITYGVDDVSGNVARRMVQRYSLQYDARASTNQTLSLYVGNTEYSYALPDPKLGTDNWLLRMNYQIRF